MKHAIGILPDFDPADDATLPAVLTTIEESAFDGMTAMTIVDACSVTSIGTNTFKICTEMSQIRLSVNCTFDAPAFEGYDTAFVFALAERFVLIAARLGLLMRKEKPSHQRKPYTGSENDQHH